MTKWFAPSGGLLPFGLDQVPGVRYVTMVLSISLSPYPKSLLEYFSFPFSFFFLASLNCFIWHFTKEAGVFF